MLNRVTFLLTFLFLLSIFRTVVLAEDLSNGQIAKNLPVADSEAKAGDIIVNTSSGLTRSTNKYDKNIFGVVGKDPSLSLNKMAPGYLPIVSYGGSKVKVSDQNGSIKAGDFVTSSTQSGVGQKATESGFVLGKALATLTTKSGEIDVFINIQYISLEAAKPSVQNSLSKAINIFSSKLEEPGNFPVILRYILAIILASGAFLFGFLAFVKAMRRGIDAIGRNPLAKRNIQLIMLLNLVGIFIVSGAGVGLALFIIFY